MSFQIPELSPPVRLNSGFENRPFEAQPENILKTQAVGLGCGSTPPLGLAQNQWKAR
jgi:hypothetical protein